MKPRDKSLGDLLKWCLDALESILGWTPWRPQHCINWGQRTGLASEWNAGPASDLKRPVVTPAESYQKLVFKLSTIKRVQNERSGRTYFWLGLFPTNLHFIHPGADCSFLLWLGMARNQHVWPRCKFAMRCCQPRCPAARKADEKNPSPPAGSGNLANPNTARGLTGFPPCTSGNLLEGGGGGPNQNATLEVQTSRDPCGEAIGGCECIPRL